MASFDSLGLIPQLLKAVQKKGYKVPTPIQAKAIPAILSGRDVIGGAQTGTGKTAAFVLPILQQLFQNRTKDRSPRALILAPTRELAAQVERFVVDYGKGLGVYSCAIYGGVKMGPQVSLLRRGVGIVVATPGRLLDHAQGGTIKLSSVETFVLDEADRMLDMGFMPDIRKIIALLPESRQNLLFSATYSDEIRRLSKKLLDDPEKIEVARRNTAAEQVRQIVHPVEQSRKRELLVELIESGDWNQVLIFARTRHGAEKLSRYLSKTGVDAVAIHGDKSQGQRTRALDRFKKGSVRVLVATDVASRGLDIRQLPRVVNYELPDVAEDYVHRIGRTGRAEEKGDAHSLVCKAERNKLAAVEELLGKKIERSEITGFEGESIEQGFSSKKGRTRQRPRSRSGRGAPRAGSKPERGTRSRPERSRRDSNRKRSDSSRTTTEERETKVRRVRKKSKSEFDIKKKTSRGPKKARPGETQEARRKRKPKWSTARKKAAKVKRASPGSKGKRKAPRQKR
ncbi:MAG: DEAD/DEAH box helicase [Verrucomicrobiaceae bacterium]|nr:MAG: DEAD/DEAH box helicase [Verrucomicrobiaceae bacterium]